MDLNGPEQENAVGEFTRSEGFFRQLVEQSTEGMAIAKLNGDLIYVNQAWGRMHGYQSLDELLGKNLAIFHTQEQLEEDVIPFNQKVIEFGTYSGEVGHVTVDGKQFPTLMTTTLLRNVKGEPIALGGIAKDITDRKRVKDALKESEEMYRTLVKTSPNSVTLSDLEGNILFASQRTLELYGFETEEEFLHSNALDRFAPEDRKKARENLKRTLQEGVVKDIQYNLLRKDGTPFIGELSASLIRDSNGDPLAFMATTRDITEQVQAKEALRESEARNSAILNAFPDLMFIQDADGTFLEYYAPDWSALYVPPHQFLGKKPQDVFPEVFATTLIGLIEQAICTSETQTFEYSLLIDNQLQYFEARIVPHGEEKVLSIIRDMTEQAQAKEALRESENKFRSITENAVDFIFIKDQSRRYTFVNRAMQDLLGLSQSEVIGKIPEEIYDPDQALIVKDVDDRSFAGETVNETRALLINGKQYFFNTIQTPLSKENGEVTSIMGIVRDVTDARQAEEALRESEERYKALFEHAKDAIFLENQNDEIIDVNRQACEMMGYSRAELLQMTVPELQAPEIRGEKGTVIKQELEKHRGGLFESFNVHRDGTRIPVEVSTAPVPGQEADLVLSIVRDITEREIAKETLQNYAHQLETLNKIAAAFATSLALEDVLNLILEQIQTVVPVDSTAIFLQEENKLQIVMDWGITPSLVGKIIVEDNPLFDLISESKEPLIVNEPLNDTRFVNWAGSDQLRTWIGVPLVVRAKLIGYLTLDSHQPDVYSLDQLPFVKSFAAQAAQAIDNARQFSTAQRRLDRLVSLHRVDQAISSSMDLRITLDILLEQVLLQLRVDAAAVLLYQPEIQSLEFVAGQGFRTQALRFTNLRLGEGFAGVAALERRVVQVSDLHEIEMGFLRAQEFRQEQFVTYIGVPLIAKGSITGVLEIYNRQPLNPNTEWMSFLNTLAGQAAIAIDNINLFSDLQRSNLELIQAYDATIEGWSSALELRDMETEGHSRRVVDITLELARRLGIDGKQLAHIRRGALLHDIGKMGVPDSILQKPDKLTGDEWKIMKQHPVYAYKMLASIPYLKPALDIPYCHHEKWDGSGYPRGLVDEQIPLAARIFAVVDVWDALRSDRPYRKAWSQKKTLAYIQNQSGVSFDPQVVSIFVDLLSQDTHLASL